MIDWCKSNKNIALPPTLSSKYSSNKEEASTTLSAEYFSVSVDYLFSLVDSNSSRHFPQVPFIKHLQYFIKILNGTLIALLPEFLLQNTYFFKSLHTLGQTLHADGRTSIGINQISVTCRPRRKTTILQRVLHPAIQRPTKVTIQVFTRTMPCQPFGFGWWAESKGSVQQV